MYARVAVVGALVLVALIVSGAVTERALAQTATPTATVTATPTPPPPPPPPLTPTPSPIPGCPAVFGGVGPAPPNNPNQVAVLVLPPDVLDLVRSGRPDALQFFYFIDAATTTPVGERVPEGAATIVASRSLLLDLSGRAPGTYRVSVVLARADRVACYDFGGVRIAVGQGSAPTPAATPVAGPGAVRPLPPATGGGGAAPREDAARAAAAFGVLLAVGAAAPARRATGQR